MRRDLGGGVGELALLRQFRLGEEDQRLARGLDVLSMVGLGCSPARPKRGLVIVALPVPRRQLLEKIDAGRRSGHFRPGFLPAKLNRRAELPGHGCSPCLQGLILRAGWPVGKAADTTLAVWL